MNAETKLDIDGSTTGLDDSVPESEQSIIINKVDVTLDTYEGFTKLKIKVAGETKEIYLENETLRVDSTNWEEKAIDSERVMLDSKGDIVEISSGSDLIERNKGGVKVKINPEGDIIEIIDGKAIGEQLFTWEAAMREAELQGKRLPFIDEENPEFQAIIKKISLKEIKKSFPGYIGDNGNKFYDQGGSVSYWTGSEGKNDIAFDMTLLRGKKKPQINWNEKNCFMSAYCVKD